MNITGSKPVDLVAVVLHNVEVKNVVSVLTLVMLIYYKELVVITSDFGLLIKSVVSTPTTVPHSTVTNKLITSD